MADIAIWTSFFRDILAKLGTLTCTQPKRIFFRSEKDHVGKSFWCPYARLPDEWHLRCDFGLMRFMWIISHKKVFQRRKTTLFFEMKGKILEKASEDNNLSGFFFHQNAVSPQPPNTVDFRFSEGIFSEESWLGEATILNRESIVLLT